MLSEFPKSKLKCSAEKKKANINCKLMERYNEIIEELDESRKKQTNFNRAVPHNLYKRLRRIIDFSLVGREEEEAIDPLLDVDGPSTDEPGAPKEMTFKEKIEAADKVYFKEQDFIIEPRPAPRNFVERPDNWMSAYLREPDKERIKWETKLYKTKKNFIEKTFDDKTEEKIDFATEGFANYVIALGEGQEDPKNNMTKDIIKQLFALFVEGDAANSLNIQPKPYTNIANTVADAWNLPQMDAETAMSNIIKCDENYKRHPLKYVSFGKAMAMSSRTPKFEDCSKEVKVDAKLEIHGFKSIKTVCDFLKKYPEINHPEFFTDQVYYKYLNVKTGLKRSPYQQ